MFSQQRVLLGLLLALFMATGLAQDAAVGSVAELRQAGGSQLSAAETKQLLTGATVESTSGVGRKRGFDNSARGTLYATSEGGSGAVTKAVRVTGDWSVREDGAYCVKVPWRAEAEEWCRFVFRLGNRYFLAGKTDDNETLRGIEIRK